MLPAQARARKTNGDFKAFVDSPSTFLQRGHSCILNQLGWALFDCQSWLGCTNPIAHAAEEGLEDFYWSFNNLLVGASSIQHWWPGEHAHHARVSQNLTSASQQSHAKLCCLRLLPNGSAIEIKCQILLVLYSQLKPIRLLAWPGHTSTGVKTKPSCMPSTSRAELFSVFPPEWFKWREEALAWEKKHFREKNQPSLNPYPISSKRAYRQLPNLCKLVVRAELKPTISNPGGHGCNSDRCAT